MTPAGGPGSLSSKLNSGRSGEWAGLGLGHAVQLRPPRTLAAFCLWSPDGPHLTWCGHLTQPATLDFRSTWLLLRPSQPHLLIPWWFPLCSLLPMPSPQSTAHTLLPWCFPCAAGHVPGPSCCPPGGFCQPRCWDRDLLNAEPGSFQQLLPLPAAWPGPPPSAHAQLDARLSGQASLSGPCSPQI